MRPSLTNNENTRDAGLISGLLRNSPISQDSVEVLYKDWYRSDEQSPPTYEYLHIYNTRDALKEPERLSLGPLPSQIDRQSSSAPNLTLLIVASLLLGVALVLAAFLLRPKLENHDMCGITTGGQVNTFSIVCRKINTDLNHIFINSGSPILLNKTDMYFCIILPRGKIGNISASIQFYVC